MGLSLVERERKSERGKSEYMKLFVGLSHLRNHTSRTHCAQQTCAFTYIAGARCCAIQGRTCYRHNTLQYGITPHTAVNRIRDPKINHIQRVSSVHQSPLLLQILLQMEKHNVGQNQPPTPPSHPAATSGCHRRSTLHSRAVSTLCIFRTRLSAPPRWSRTCRKRRRSRASHGAAWALARDTTPAARPFDRWP